MKRLKKYENPIFNVLYFDYRDILYDYGFTEEKYLKDKV